MLAVESIAAALVAGQWRRRAARATGTPGFSRGFSGGSARKLKDVANQLLSSALIRLSNSSNEVSPLTISPLMKNVGVELTFSTSLANF